MKKWIALIPAVVLTLSLCITATVASSSADLRLISYPELGFGTNDTVSAQSAPTVHEPIDAYLIDVFIPNSPFSTKVNVASRCEADVGILRVWTGSENDIPYVLIVLYPTTIDDPFEYIKEMTTPIMQEGYEVLDYEEYAAYDIGGKSLPAGWYLYKDDHGQLIERIQIVDSTGRFPVIFDAKYLQGQGDATLQALDTTIRYSRIKTDDTVAKPTDLTGNDRADTGDVQRTKDVLRPVQIAWGDPDTQNGTYWVKISDTDKIFNGGFFTASLYEQDRYDLSGIEGLSAGDRVQVNGHIFTVDKVMEHDGGNIEIIPKEELYGYIVFKKQENDYLAMVDGWTPVTFVADYKVMLPLPDDFSYISIEGGKDTVMYDWESFVSLLTGSNPPDLNPYNTAIGFQDDLVMTIVHSDSPEGPSN